MSFPRYPKYKPSGVEWLGDVPEHWSVKRLKHNARLLTEKTDRRDHPVGLENIEGWSGRFIPTETAFEGEGIAFDAGDILFGKLRPYLAKAYLAQSSGEAVGDFHVMRPAVGIEARFAQYQILNREFIAIVDGSTFGSKMPRASWEFVGGMKVTLPPLPEQTAIADFLDWETAKIDGLVAEQRRLMELLKEKRQAVISHAVTKGLNPHAPMKPSGIEWIGDVPEGWTVIQIRQAAKLESGHTPSRQHPEYWENCTVPWFTLADVWQIRDAKAEYLFDTKEKVSELGLANSSARLLPKHTVILSRTASVGFSGIMAVDMATTQDFANWICGPRLQPEFLLYVLRAMDGEFRRLMMGSTHNTIYMPDIKSLRFALPSRDQQIAIVKHVRKMTQEFDTLTAEAQRAIDFLQERRTALISAAVTGQIDVRQPTRN